ncbi:hypothetical protein BH11MYX3_BH11MYX3_33310 [soil metagenome]
MRAARRTPKTPTTKRPPARTKRAPRKTPTNLSLRSDLVERAKALGLNLSDVVERSLEAVILDAERTRWLADNEAAIEHYNAFVEKHGLFGDEFRAY